MIICVHLALLLLLSTLRLRLLHLLLLLLLLCVTNGVGVVCRAKNQLGCAVVPRANVRHVRLAGDQALCAAHGKPEESGGGGGGGGGGEKEESLVSKRIKKYRKRARELKKYSIHNTPRGRKSRKRIENKFNVKQSKEMAVHGEAQENPGKKRTQEQSN